MNTFQPAYMGEFLREYKPPLVSLNATLNYFLTKPVVIRQNALVVQEIQFPDASFYQGEIDYGVMSTKTKAIILRAGQGSWIDTQFERNYAEAKRTGLLVGVYWFYDDRVSPREQAELLLSVLKGKKMDMEVFIDWENTYGGAYKGLPNVVAMMQAVENQGYRVGLYTGYYWFRSNSNPIVNVNQYNYLQNKPLWEAWYSSSPMNVLIPAPWTSLTHWQFGTPVVSWGQKTSELDMNFYNGSVRDFDLAYGEKEMQIIKGEVIGSVKIRKSPAGEEFVPSRYLMVGDNIEASENNTQWLHITKTNGVPVTDPQWASAGTLQQYIKWQWVDIEPEPPSEEYVLHVKDGVTRKFILSE